MYKLVNGKLVTPPKVFNGIIGYNNDLARLSKDGWKPLLEEGEGPLFRYVEKAQCIVKQYYKPAYDYRAERKKAYPELGDVVDALLKAYQGDSEELEMIITQRQIIKESIKKIQ